MRNSELDKKLSIDRYIGDLYFDENGCFRMILGIKIRQIKEKTQADKDINLIINRNIILNMLEVAKTKSTQVESIIRMPEINKTISTKSIRVTNFKHNIYLN